MAETFSHVAEDGSARMVDVSGKPLVRRVALAEGEIRLQPGTIERINSNQIAKGNVLGVARVAAIQAIKRTDELIPLCHSLPIQHAEVDFVDGPMLIQIRCRVTSTAQTGVEMEALTGVAVAALTIYDMCKAVDKSMVIGEIRLLSKAKQPL
jgi:cyclic pyranopterin monophosphate synthase